MILEILHDEIYDTKYILRGVKEATNEYGENITVRY